MVIDKTKLGQSWLSPLSNPQMTMKPSNGLALAYRKGFSSKHHFSRGIFVSFQGYKILEIFFSRLEKAYNPMAPTPKHGATF